MNFQTIFLYFGRALIFIFLFIVFILALVECVQRGDVDKTVPDNFHDSKDVISYVIKNLQAPPIHDLKVQSTITAGFEADTLFEWQTTLRYCDCSTTTVPGIFHDGLCTTDEKARSCLDNNRATKDLEKFKGFYFDSTPLSSFEYPSKKGECATNIFEYKDKSELCIKPGTTTPLVAQVLPLTGILFTSTAPTVATDGWTLKATIPATGTNKLYVTSAKLGSPILGVKVSPGGLPCVNPKRNPTTVDVEILGFSHQGCGGLGAVEADDKWLQKIDTVSEWDLYTENVIPATTLLGYKDKVGTAEAVLYAENKLNLNQDQKVCLDLPNRETISTDVDDVPLLASYREILNILGFVVVALAIVVFIIYLVATRGLSAGKTVRKEEIGIYVFWFEHILGVVYSVVTLIIGWITYDLIEKLDSRNSELYKLNGLNCFTNGAKINAVINSLSNGIFELYSYVVDINHAGVVVAIIFLVFELIILLAWACGFRCSEYLGESDDERNRLTGGKK